MRLAILILFLSISRAAQAQEINIYSEFERFDPFGRVVAQDRDMRPREVLSPAVPRNGHLSVHVVVSAPAGTNYFLYAGSSPIDILQVRIYREHFVRCGDDYCPDYLTEQRSPSFGAMPESVRDIPEQTTRCYLFDIWVPPNVPPRRVRIEALLKTGIWMVAPMEVRVIDPIVPDTKGLPVADDVAPLNAPSSATAQRQLFRYLDGLQPDMPRSLARVRDIIQRNAAEDMLVARSLDMRAPEPLWLAWSPFVFPEVGAEWYLRVRDFIYRFPPAWR
ncbi:MAG TPA: hypothetical protein VFC21_05435 [Bryobacteraceae bacterium]|nr:hypothetical protein [Bryobacteraceae bacterium]